MSAWAYQVLKITILVVLYVFLFRVFKLMVSDIFYTSKKATKPLPLEVKAELIIMESVDPILKPGDVLMLKQVQTNIGRGKNNNINLEDSYISHNHARILYQEGNFYIEDLGSINGTFINGVKIDGPVPIHHGDIIKIRENVFKFAGWKNEVE